MTSLIAPRCYIHPRWFMLKNRILFFWFSYLSTTFSTSYQLAKAIQLKKNNMIKVTIFSSCMDAILGFLYELDITLYR